MIQSEFSRLSRAKLNGLKILEVRFDSTAYLKASLQDYWLNYLSLNRLSLLLVFDSFDWNRFIAGLRLLEDTLMDVYLISRSLVSMLRYPLGLWFILFYQIVYSLLQLPLNIKRLI